MIHGRILSIPSSFLCGDANKDGLVTIADVIRIIRSLIGLDPDPGCQGDFAAPFGLITRADVLKILDYLLGKIASLTCCGG